MPEPKLFLPPVCCSGLIYELFQAVAIMRGDGGRGEGPSVSSVKGNPLHAEAGVALHRCICRLGKPLFTWIAQP